jgi:hypothetical protein
MAQRNFPTTLCVFHRADDVPFAERSLIVNPGRWYRFKPAYLRMRLTPLPALAWLSVLCALSQPSHCADLHRCVSPEGVIGYHAAACPDQHRMSRVIHYEPVADSVPVVTPAQPHISRGRIHVGRPRNTIGARRETRNPTRNERCRIAKQQRKLSEDKLGLTRTYATLGELDAPVRAACNGY